MSVFKKIAAEQDYFYYQVGKVSTEKIWTKPSYQKIKDFLMTIKNETNILSEFNLHLIGGVLHSFDNTWDVDFCMTGEVKDPQVLESHMNVMYDIALNHFNLLIDIQWLKEPASTVSYEQLTSGEYVSKGVEFKKIGYIKKQINDDVSESDFRDRFTNVSEYLIEGIYGGYPGRSQKLIDRILQNPNRILKTSFDVETFLNTDEEYFLTNTNRI